MSRRALSWTTRSRLKTGSGRKRAQPPSPALSDQREPSRKVLKTTREEPETITLVSDREVRRDFPVVYMDLATWYANLSS